MVTGSSPHGIINGTFGLSSGKWYYELKVATAASNNWDLIGISDLPSLAASDWLGLKANAWGWAGYTGGEIYNNNAVASTTGVTHTTGDILGCYIDLDNNKLYYAKNGTLVSSTGLSLTAAASTTDGHYFPSCGDYSGSSTGTYELNFGNGYFGTTAVTSAVADEGGIGQFEYDPSSGTFDGSSKDFRAICTNNIATYG